MSVRILHPVLALTIACAAAPAVHAQQKPQSRDILVPEVLKTAGEYLTQYTQKLGAVVAEEEYTQREPALPSANRRLTSEVAFIGLDNGQVAVYRDVASIDGR